MKSLHAYVADRVIEDGDCLRWIGTTYNGHPGGTLDKKKVLIRRAMYEAKYGPIPKGRVIRCTCETPLCVAEEHFNLSTYKAIAKECGALGLMSGPVRSARIAAVKRAGTQAKILQEDALTIFSSNEKGSVLALRYGISESTVSKIKRGQMRREFVGNPWVALG